MYENASSVGRLYFLSTILMGNWSGERETPHPRSELKWNFLWFFQLAQLELCKTLNFFFSSRLDLIVSVIVCDDDDQRSWTLKTRHDDRK